MAAGRSRHRSFGSPRCQRQGVVRCRPGRTHRRGDSRFQDGELEQFDAHRWSAQSGRHGPLRSRGRSAGCHGDGTIRRARPARAASGGRQLARSQYQRARPARQSGEAAGRHGGAGRQRRRSHGCRARWPPAGIRPSDARRQARCGARRKSQARVAERHDGRGLGDRRCRLVPAQDRDRRGQGDRRTPQPGAVLRAGRAAACRTRPPRTDGAPRWPGSGAGLAGNTLRCRRPRRAARPGGARGDSHRQSRPAPRPDLVARRYQGGERRGHLRPVGQRQGGNRQVRSVGRAAAALHPAPGTFGRHDRVLDHRVAPGRLGRRQPHGRGRRRGPAAVDCRPLRPRRGRRHHRAELRRPLGKRRAKCHRSRDHAGSHVGQRAVEGDAAGGRGSGSRHRPWRGDRRGSHHRSAACGGTVAGARQRHRSSQRRHRRRQPANRRHDRRSHGSGRDRCQAHGERHQRCSRHRAAERHGQG